MEITEYALGRLRAALTALEDDVGVSAIHEDRDKVYQRYRPAFQSGSIDTIEEKVLSSFLYSENNLHWSGLHRQVNRICADMTLARRALTDLVDESQPLAERMQSITDLKGMGKGISTAILHVAYPEKYGVWNNTSDEALIDLELYPEFPRGASFGERYEAINEVLTALAKKLKIDFWTLDTIWWYLWSDEEETEGDAGGDADPPPIAQRAIGGASTKSSRFSLERHLHDYMCDNWDSLDLSQEWEIYARDGEPDIGYEYVTPVGRIDLLAKHKSESRWLVVELKREKSSDVVVGQVLRYMGWISRHLVEDGETVEGLVVATEGDPQLHYALDMIPSVTFKTYVVDFCLKDGPSFEQFQKP